MMPQTIIQDVAHERRMSFILRYRKAVGNQAPIGSLMAASQSYDAVYLMLRALFQTKGRHQRPGAQAGAGEPAACLLRRGDDLPRPPFTAADHDAMTRNMLWLGLAARRDPLPVPGRRQARRRDPAQDGLSPLQRRAAGGDAAPARGRLAVISAAPSVTSHESRPTAGTAGIPRRRRRPPCGRHLHQPGREAALAELEHRAGQQRTEDRIDPAHARVGHGANRPARHTQVSAAGPSVSRKRAEGGSGPSQPSDAQQPRGGPQHHAQRRRAASSTSR